MNPTPQSDASVLNENRNLKSENRLPGQPFSADTKSAGRSASETEGHGFSRAENKVARSASEEGVAGNPAWVSPGTSPSLEGASLELSRAGSSQPPDHYVSGGQVRAGSASSQPWQAAGRAGGPGLDGAWIEIFRAGLPAGESMTGTRR